MVPREVQTRDEITFIRDLMGADRKSWDATIVTANFPGDICNKILSQGNRTCLFGLPPRKETSL